MTKVLIIGAGDSGLNLCNRLLGAGIEVTLADPRTPEAILWEPEHKLTSLNLPYSQNLIRPEWSGLSQWESKAREVSFRTVQLRLHDPEEPGKELSLVGSLPGEGGFAFEPRLRQHCWLSAATDPVLHDGRPARHVEALYEHSALDFAASRRIADIVVVAVGNGRLGHEFDADAERAGRLRGAGGRPRVRTVTQAYFHALRPGEADAQVISAPAGEVIAVPAFTTEGPAHSIQLIGTPDGPWTAPPACGRAGSANARSTSTGRCWKRSPTSPPNSTTGSSAPRWTPPR
ncbi:styrene monooxygenase/indole monooxygenase family protein [Nocardiopsis composta]